MKAKPSPSARNASGVKPRRASVSKPQAIRQDADAPKRITAVLERARESGLSASKSSRISGRVSPELIAHAKARTGITSDTELIEFALANIAIEDRFLEVFRQLKGTVDPELDLEF